MHYFEAAPHKLFTIPCLPKLDLDYTYSQLSDIVQLDGAADNSDPEEDEDLPLEENDFLGLINAEAIRALKEENGSDSNSISSSSDDGVVDELVNAEEEEEEVRVTCNPYLRVLFTGDMQVGKYLPWSSLQDAVFVFF